jgi:hypothetical protein
MNIVLLELTPEFFELSAEIDDLGTQCVDCRLERVESVGGGTGRVRCVLGRRSIAGQKVHVASVLLARATREANDVRRGKTDDQALERRFDL